LACPPTRTGIFFENGYLKTRLGQKRSHGQTGKTTPYNKG
jgi:hypothetical protein